MTIYVGSQSTSIYKGSTSITNAYVGSNSVLVDSLKNLKSASIAAAGNNPVELTDMASPPTVTISNTTDATLVQVSPQIRTNTLIYKTSGKSFAAFTTEWLRMAHLSLSPRTDGNIKAAWGAQATIPTTSDGTDQGNSWIVRFKATGLSVFEFQYPSGTVNTPLRITADGRYVNRDGHGAVFASNQRVKVDFGAAATREIEIEVALGSASIGALKMNTGAVLIPCTTRPKAVSVGTSFEEGQLIGKYTAGTWTPDAAGVDRFAQWDNHVAVFCKLNGYDLRNSALGGTGYIATAGAKNIVGQMDYWIADDTYDLVIFGGPYNDKDLNQTTMRANARAAWEKARTNQPNAIILVHGCCGGSNITNDSSSTITAESNLKAEFDAWVAAGERKAYFIPVSPNYATALIKDTNYTNWISTDNTHPYRGDATHGHVGLGYYFNTKWRTLIGL